MIRLIAAHDSMRGIAKNGVQPWKIPEDEAYFNRQTLRFGATVLMGRRTFNVIGHPLKNRTNVILSREKVQDTAEVTYVSDLEEFLKSGRDIWVIGGASLYEQALSDADELYITSIDADLHCDLFFPEYEHLFTEIHKSEPKSQNGLTYTYSVYSKK